MIRTLIVEDDPMVAEINKRYIESVDGFKVVGICKDEISGLKFLKENKVDLIIIDIYLPKGDGLGFLRKVRQKNIDADVIMVTAASEADAINEALRLGAIDYLIKPFEYERLRKTMEKYKKIHIILNESDKVDQEDLDRFFRYEDELEILPKGLNNMTLKRFKKFMDSNSEKFMGVEEIAAALDISKVTVRRYMDYLVTSGYITQKLEYGTIGRPSYLYKKS